MALSVDVKTETKRVGTLLSQMTLDEKLAQLGSYWVFDLQTKGQFDSSKLENKLKDGIGQMTRLAGSSTLDPVAAAKAANSLQRFLVEKTRLRIPAIIHEESCSGAMVLGGTMFPQMLGLAATFEPRLATEMADVIRKQLRAIGAHQGLSPVLDVARDPRWGRVEETFGEDPGLVSQFGIAYVRGLQGADLSDGVMATGKHFVGHSLSLGGLNCAPVQVGARELWTTYLAPFHAVIRDADLASIMNAYPELDGELVAASHRILTQVLREQLGFDGVLVSDYNAINMLHDYHSAASDLKTAAAWSLRAGIDVELPTTFCFGDPLRAALEAGEINLELIDTAVKRHLQKKEELGLFDHPYVDEGKVLEVFETPDQRTLARELAANSLVLLKNDGTLPLQKELTSLALIGPNADSARNLLGDYSYASVLERVALNPPENSSFVDIASDQLSQHDIKVMTILDGIRSIVSKATTILHERGCDNNSYDRSGFAAATAAAKKADAVVLVLGDHSGLTLDCTTGETRDSVDLRLPGVQEELARAVIEIGKPVVVVLVNGRPFAIPWIDEHANAILEAWLPGEEGGAAIADALFGNVNPGGKLPITFPRHVGQVPIFYGHKPAGAKSNWHNDYVQESVKPLYSLGHGLSYTKFEFSELSLSHNRVRSGETIEVSLHVKNTGTVPGDEVVQLYVRDLFASIPQPIKDLKGFVRISLQPSQSRKVTFHLPANQLAFFNSNMDFVLERGKVEIMVGASSEDIRLRGEFEIIDDATLPIADRVFTCQVEIQ
jgi:beta-glucosidase